MRQQQKWRSRSRPEPLPPVVNKRSSLPAIHQDLNFFADNMWKLGMNVTAGKFLFLGDYVDRGMQGLECLAYLFSLKVGMAGETYHNFPSQE